MPRISLREFLTLFALVAMAIASLLYASAAFRVLVSLLTMLAYIGAVIAVIVDRGPRQAFAIGLAISMTIYAVLIIHARVAGHQNYNAELYADEVRVIKGSLPTTSILQKVLSAIVEWKDDSRVRNRADEPEFPNSREIMRIGHCWWALLLGYVGGRFAAFLYTRRIREQQPLATKSS
jgi:hypothetical protein